MSGRRSSLTRTRRGRPFKFGRPSQAVVLTLPRDVLDKLRSVGDPARTIVSLVERLDSAPLRPSQTPRAPLPPAELVSLPGRRSLIVIRPHRVRKLRGVALIPLPDGRAFLALEPLQGMADLELAVTDALEENGLTPRRRAELEVFRDQLRTWRRTPRLRFSSRSIILAEGLGTTRRRATAGAKP